MRKIKIRLKVGKKMKSRRKEDSGVIGKDVLGFSYI